MRWLSAIHPNYEKNPLFTKYQLIDVRKGGGILRNALFMCESVYPCVSPAYGHIKSALVKCSNKEGPGPRHNRKEDPGTSTLIMKGEHGQEVPCDPGQVTSILGRTCPPLPPPPPPGHPGQNTLPPPFRGHTPPPV